MILKRLFDLVVSFVALLVLLPFFVLLAIAIKIDSDGPVFYRGVRVGRNGKPFRIYKFRSMVDEAEKKGASSTSDNDMRVTRVGMFIRRLKLDELSQLINVLLGDMSFVGPRPEVQKFVDMYTEEEREILKMRPGITDWSSIKFFNEGEIIAESGIADADEAYMKLIRPEKLKLQLKYVRERTFMTDMHILVKTVRSLFSSRAGAGKS